MRRVPASLFNLAAKFAVAGSLGGRPGCSKCIGLSRRNSGRRIAGAQMGPGPTQAQTNGELHLIAAATYGGLTGPLPLLLVVQDGLASLANLSSLAPAIRRFMTIM